MMGGMASTKLVANWFIAKRGQALGIATMGVSLSGMVMPTIATWLVGEFGWRGGFQVYAAGILVIVVPVVALLVVTAPEEVGQRPDGDAPDAPEPPAKAADVVWSTRGLLRTGNFWVIALPFGMSFSALSAVLIHLPPYAEDLGFGGYLPARALSAAAAAGVLGKLVFGRLVDRGDPRVAVWISFGTQIVGLGMLMNASSYTTLLVGALVFGFGMGGVVPLQGAVSGRAFGRLSFGKVMGLMQPVRVPLNMIGVPLAAGIRDATGSFDLAFWIFVGVYVASAGTIALLRVPSGD
jgi:MFS family permease